MRRLQQAETPEQKANRLYQSRLEAVHTPSELEQHLIEQLSAWQCYAGELSKEGFVFYDGLAYPDKQYVIFELDDHVYRAIPDFVRLNQAGEISEVIEIFGALFHSQSFLEKQAGQTGRPVYPHQYDCEARTEAYHRNGIRACVVKESGKNLSAANLQTISEFILK